MRRCSRLRFVFSARRASSSVRMSRGTEAEGSYCQGHASVYMRQNACNIADPAFEVTWNDAKYIGHECSRPNKFYAV